MKKYIKSNSSVEEINITDLFSSIVQIVIVPDVREVVNGSVMCSTGFDFSGLSDEDLLELDINDIHEIDDISVLQRIYKAEDELRNRLGRNYEQAFERLTRHQLELVKREFETKIIIDKQDVENILNDLRKCNRITVERTNKNMDFNAFFTMTDAEKLDVIKNLTIGDFVSLTKSYTSGHVGNDLIVFITEVQLETNDGWIWTDVYVCIKIDLQSITDTGAATALVSFHTAERTDFARIYHKGE